MAQVPKATLQGHDGNGSSNSIAKIPTATRQGHLLFNLFEDIGKCQDLEAARHAHLLDAQVARIVKREARQASWQQLPAPVATARRR